MSPDQQQQYMQAQASSTGSTQTYVFPILGEGIGLWLRWFVLGAVLHLALTMLGSRSTSATAFNLTAWASLPFAIRLLVQIGAMLATHQVIRSPGLSGMLAADARGVLLFAKIMLGMVDAYLFWQIGLLWMGARLSGLPGRKALGGVLASVILLLALSALPAFLTAQFSGLDVNRPFFLF